MAIKIQGIVPRMWRKIKRLLLFLFILHLIYVFLLLIVFPPITITQVSNFIFGNGLKRHYVSYSSISTNMKLAVIAAEDQLFPGHNGFDWKSVQKAVEHNKENPSRVRGASTISQQVAKNVFLWQGRSWFRKALEVYSTFLIELIWSKKRILATYLNVVETGKGIFGVERAANIYFNKSASELTRSEAAQIAACLPNPKRYTVKPISGYVSRRSQWILKQMNHLSGDEVIEKMIE